MTTEKVGSYTDEQVQTLTKMYLEANSVEAIATVLGKSVRSVIAKLAQLGVYKKSESAKSARVTKMDLIAQIASQAGVPLEVMKSLEKADKQALEVIFEKLC